MTFDNVPSTIETIDGELDTLALLKESSVFIAGWLLSILNLTNQFVDVLKAKSFLVIMKQLAALLEFSLNGFVLFLKFHRHQLALCKQASHFDYVNLESFAARGRSESGRGARSSADSRSLASSAAAQSERFLGLGSFELPRGASRESASASAAAREPFRCLVNLPLYSYTAAVLALVMLRCALFVSQQSAVADYVSLLFYASSTAFLAAKHGFAGGELPFFVSGAQTAAPGALSRFLCNSKRLLFQKRSASARAAAARRAAPSSAHSSLSLLTTETNLAPQSASSSDLLESNYSELRQVADKIRSLKRLDLCEQLAPAARSGARSSASTPFCQTRSDSNADSAAPAKSDLTLSSKCTLSEESPALPTFESVSQYAELASLGTNEAARALHSPALPRKKSFFSSNSLQTTSERSPRERARARERDCERDCEAQVQKNGVFGTYAKALPRPARGHAAAAAPNAARSCRSSSPRSSLTSARSCSAAGSRL